MKVEENIMKIEYFCPECGGTNVLTQNWLEWNKEKQEWKVADDFPDHIDWIEWCMDCDEEIWGLDECKKEITSYRIP